MAVDKGPHFTIHHHDTHVELKRKENELQYHSGNLQLRINTGQNAFGTEFRSNDMAATSNLTSHSDRSVGYVSDEKPYPYEDGLFRDRKGYMLAGLDLSYDEKIYGLGERFGPLVLNGQSVTMSNEDGGSSSEMAYKNIPFYLSSKGYGVFMNHPGHVSFEVGTERTTRVNVSVAGQELEYFVIYGPSPAEVLRKYSALMGRPAVPPVWSYQLWLSTSFTTEYDEGTITSFLDGFKDKGIPLGAMVSEHTCFNKGLDGSANYSVQHLDCFWMKAFHWCDFEFDKDIYPDYNGLLRRLKDRGLKVCVWINPYIAQASPLFEEGRKSGYFIKRTNGNIFQWDAWQ
ncbi:hypothetical protein KEM55_006244 [Ascosphaera atra]|nr:hypothetical protein KEM55_006244 [Ascosphaera atra]